MKKLFAVFLFIFLGSIFALSQTDTPKTADWQTFTPVGEEFSIEVPIPLNASIFPNVDQKNVSTRYINSLNGTYFYIFSDDAKKPWQFEFVSAFANNNKQGEIAKNVDGIETEKFKFTDSEDFYHTVLAIKGKDRYYIFQTISQTKENSVVERFFDSIKFTSNFSVENSAEITKEKDITINVPTSNTQNKQTEVGNGSGSGIGNGEGNKISPETKTQSPNAPTNITAGVRILTKPRANYTDFARFYEMTGKVTLRVTFSANGTIGAISILAKLPFGLTKQAIIAAKGIKFEPAMRDGITYSVTKPVEYSFIIY